MSQYDHKSAEEFEGGDDQSSELDQMHQEFKEFQKQQALKREREALERNERMEEQPSMSSYGHQPAYQPPHVRNPNLSQASLQMEDEVNQSKAGQVLPLQEENLQNQFIREPKSSAQSKESPEITDNYLFQQRANESVSRDLEQSVKPFDARGPASGEKEHLSFGDQRMSNQKQPSMRGSNRDLADPFPGEQRHSLRSGRRTNDHEDSQNFGAMQNADDRQRLEDFMRGDSTSLSRANRSFAEDVQRENSVKEFSAAKRPASRSGGRADVPESVRSSRRSSRGGEAEPVEIDRIVVEKSPRKERASKKSSAGSRGRQSVNDSKLEERAGSMSSIGKGSSNAKDLVPFVDEKLSNINDTRMSNALQPRRNQDNNQSISVLANVFDQIDPTNPKDSVKKINDSLYDINNESKMSVKHGENSKENEYGTPSHHGNDTGNFALQNSNNSKSHQNSGLGASNLHNQSRGTRGSHSKQPDYFYEPQPRETFNPNDYEKLRVNQSLEQQMQEKEQPQTRAPMAVKSRAPTQEELQKMDREELDRLMEAKMDEIMARQRKVGQPQPKKEDDQLRHQTPFFALRDDEGPNSQQLRPVEYQPPYPTQHARHLSNSKKERPPPTPPDDANNFSVGHRSLGGAPMEEASIRSIDQESLKIQTLQQSHPEDNPNVHGQYPMSTPKDSESQPSQYSTDRHDQERLGEEFRAWQQKKNEEMQLKKNDYFSRNSASEVDRAPSRRGPVAQQMAPEYEQRSQQRGNDSFSNNSQPNHDLMQQPDNMSHQNYRPEANSAYHPPVIESRRPVMTQPENYPTNHSQADVQSHTQQMMPMLHPQKQVYPQQQQSYHGTRNYQPPGSMSGRPQSNTRRDFQPMLKSGGPADPWTPQQPSQAESTMNLTRNSSIGSRMSRAGRTQRFADGRQSRSNSRGDKHECEISAVSIIKSPRVNRQSSRDVSLDIKRKRMAEDMAKAQEAQRQLEDIARRKRQQEQRKLFQDIEQTKFGHQVLPSQKSQQPYVKSRKRQGDSDADDFGDDEFNDIDEGTIKAGGPQNHRRVQQNQGPLNQRNMVTQATIQDSPDDDNNTLDTRRQLHRGNNRGVKILQISDIHEKRNPSPNKDQRVVNGRFGPTIVNAHDYSKPQPYTTEPQMKQGGGTGSPFYANNVDDNFSHRTSDSRTQQILPVRSFSALENQKRQRANDELFSWVMREKDPKQALNQYVMKDRSTFDMYKDSMAELTGRIDRELSRIRSQNKVADRLIDQQRARDQNLQKYQDHINQQRQQDEMRECTFTPKIGQQRTNSRTRQASPAQFVKNEQAFLQRKQNWINEQNNQREQEFQRMQQTKYVNEGSRKILHDRRGSNASGANEQQRPQSRADSRASDGSNPRSDALNDVLNRSQDRKFKFFNNGQKKKGDSRAGSNTRGAGSRSGSNSRGSRIAGLAQYSGVEKRAPGNASKSPSRVSTPSASATSDNYLTMQLHREYQDVIQHHVYERGSLHIEDILQDMGFIDERMVSNQRTRLGIMLRQQRNNLLLCDSQGAVMSQETDEITQNLFKVLCSIMNLKQTTNIYRQLDQNLLNSYLTYIDLNKDDQDILILEQLATIKSLINRQPYSLDDNQVLSVHKKFLNLFENRKNSIEATKKLAFESRVADQNKGMFKPQIDYKSAQYKPQASVYDRSQEFRKLPDKDPRDIEYEQQQQHCTFKPMTNKGRPWQGNRPPSRAGSGVRGGGSRAGERPQSGGSGTNNTSITRQRFGPTVHTQTTKRNDSGVRMPGPGAFVRNSSPHSAMPVNQYVAQPSRASDPEPFSESDPSFKETYLNKNVNETESSLSLNPQKFHDRQNKQRMQTQQHNMPEPASTIDDPDTYIGARETYKDEAPQMLRTPSRSVQSHTRSLPRVQPKAQYLNQSNASNAIPNELLQSNTQAQRYEQEPQFNGNEQVETNSMVNDSFGPATNDHVMANYLPPSSNLMPPQSNFAHDNQSQALNQRYLAQDPSTKHSQPSQSVENESTLQQSPNFKNPRDGRQPICVLKIELDRQNMEEIRVYDGEDPTQIVNQFGAQFNLTENAMVKLHQQILEQIQINQSKSGRSRQQMRR